MSSASSDITFLLAIYSKKPFILASLLNFQASIWYTIIRGYSVQKWRITMKNQLLFPIVLALLMCTLNTYSIQLPDNIMEVARATQPNGKTLVLGSSGHDGINLIRYNTNDLPDMSFGANGMISLAIGESAQPESIAIQPDGKILVNAIVDGEPAHIRFKNDGLLDIAFGQNGILRPKAETKKLL